MRRRPAHVLAGIAVAGQTCFGLAWFGLGLRHDEYDPLAGTISALAGHDARAWPVMVAGFLTAAVAHTCTATLLVRPVVDTAHPIPPSGRDRDARPVAAVLLVAAGASVAAGLARTRCGPGVSGTWCAPGAEHATSVALHGGAATVALVALALAPLVAVVRPPLSGSGGRPWAAVTAVPAVASLLWFAGQLDPPGATGGLAEKVFTTVVGVWSAGTAVAAARARRA